MAIVAQPHLASDSNAPVTENRNLSDPEEIEKAIKLGEYIRNGTLRISQCASFSTQNMYSETLALYSLRKYRHLKRMYPQDSFSDPPP